MMFSSYAIAACEKNNVSFAEHGREAVLVARDGIYDLLGELCEDLVDRRTLAEGDPFSEFAFYRARAMLVYMLMAAYWLWSEAEGWKRPHHKEIIEKVIPADPPARWLW